MIGRKKGEERFPSKSSFYNRLAVSRAASDLKKYDKMF
jgi:hypothetical protein